MGDIIAHDSITRKSLHYKACRQHKVEHVVTCTHNCRVTKWHAQMREKRTLCKVQNTHTGHKRETIYIYVEESTSKHRVSSSISTYYACRDTLEDTGRNIPVIVDVCRYQVSGIRYSYFT